MNDKEKKQALKNAVAEWKKKHNIQDGDPILAMIEVWEIYFHHSKLSKQRIPSFDAFRDSLNKIDGLSKEFAKHGSEIIQELRSLPKIKTDLNRFPVFALVFTAVIALLAGILIGKFLL